MKAMLLAGIRKIRMVEVPDPVMSHDTDVLIKMKVVGVCGSDVHYYKQGKIGSQIVQFLSHSDTKVPDRLLLLEKR